MKMKIGILVGLFITGMTLTACRSGAVDVAKEQDSETSVVGLPNPSAVYCEGMGYASEIRTDASGAQDGACIFPDGSECGEWDFMAGRCGQQHTFCVQQGYELKPGPNIATCVFPDGSSCLEIDYFTGDCAPGQNYLESEALEEDLESEAEIEPASGQEVIGWMGRVLTATDSPYDDYLLLPPEGTGEIGLLGADETVESQIVALRDAEPPGDWANFWGTLNCGVDDFNGCQLVVTRIRAGTEITQTEPVSLSGRIYSNPEGTQFSQYFMLEGDFPVRFGINSFIAENGWPVYNEEIAARRDTEQLVQVDGNIRCGVPDVNGCQIQVERLVVDGAVIDPYEGWGTYTNDDYGFTFRYPPAWILEEEPERDETSQGGRHYGPALKLTRDTAMLFIGYKYASQDYIWWTGVGAWGDAEDQGMVAFLGQMLEKTAMVFEGKVNYVGYGMAEAGDLAFGIRLDDISGGAPDEVEIPEDVQHEVDQILGSFERTE
jgi:putative hemolysin